MKTVWLIVLTLVVTTLARTADEAVLKADHKEAVEQQLVKVERNWNEAMKNRDKPALSALCAEDYLYTGDDGKTINRAFYISEVTTHVKVIRYTLSSVSARSYGDTGIVHGEWDGTVEADGQSAEIKLRFTDTFVRRDNRWWAVASQSTRIPE
jgi:ketosteroid isomerase-like protein